MAATLAEKGFPREPLKIIEICNAKFAGVRSKNGMSGFSPIIEFEIPTRSGDGKRIHTLVGFSTALSTGHGMETKAMKRPYDVAFSVAT